MVQRVKARLKKVKPLIKQSKRKVSRWWCKDTKSQGHKQVQAKSQYIPLYSARYGLYGTQA
jgi:hypothetical protein